jgi:hypothetical protein
MSHAFAYVRASTVGQATHAHYDDLGVEAAAPSNGTSTLGTTAIKLPSAQLKIWRWDRARFAPEPFDLVDSFANCEPLRYD